MQVQCKHCEKKFNRSKSEVKRVKNTFCCVKCRRLYHESKHRLCLQCKTKTKNTKFCSKSCAAIYNNKKFPKRMRKKHFCITCGTEVINKRKYCDEHNPQKVDWSKVTISDVEDHSGRPANKYRGIRDHSRKTYRKSDKPRRCIKCNYNKHFDVCHVKDIKTFSKDTPISVVNSLDNLVALCKNCHWEFDNGFLHL